MNRPVAVRLLAAGATTALAATIGLTALAAPGAVAVTGTANGFAATNGGTKTPPAITPSPPSGR